MQHKGYAVEALLYWVAEQVRGHGAHNWIDYEWRLYNIVYHYYLQGGKVAELVAKMGIGEAAFYKSVRRAVAVSAEILQRELDTNGDQFGRKTTAITLRHNRLPPPQQAILQHLAILRTPIDLTHFAGSDLQQLQQQNLIDLTEQVTIHPDIRATIATLIAPTIKTELHRNAAQAYTTSETYLEACHHYRLANQTDQTIELLITHQDRFFAEEEIALLEAECLALKEVRVSAEKQPQLQLVMGRVAMWSKNRQVAQEAFRQALGSTDIETQAAAYYYLGRSQQTNQIDGAVHHFQRAIALLEDHKSPILVRAMIDLAWVFLRERVDVDSAESHLQNAQTTITNFTTDQLLCSDLHSAWARFYELKQDVATRTHHAWCAWQLAHEAQNPRHIMNTAHNLGIIHLNQQQPQQALPYLEECLTYAAQNNNTYFIASSQMHIGGCHYYHGDFPAAKAAYLHSYEKFLALGMDNLQAYNCYNLAEVLAQLGEVDQARNYYQEGWRLGHALSLDDFLQGLAGLGVRFRELSADLSPHEQKIIGYVRQHGRITNKVALQLLPVAARQIGRILATLCTQSILKRRGKGRATHYVLSATHAKSSMPNRL